MEFSSYLKGKCFTSNVLYNAAVSSDARNGDVKTNILWIHRRRVRCSGTVALQEHFDVGGVKCLREFRFLVLFYVSVNG